MKLERSQVWQKAGFLGVGLRRRPALHASLLKATLARIVAVLNTCIIWPRNSTVNLTGEYSCIKVNMNKYTRMTDLYPQSNSSQLTSEAAELLMESDWLGKKIFPWPHPTIRYRHEEGWGPHVYIDGQITNLHKLLKTANYKIIKHDIILCVIL